MMIAAKALMLSSRPIRGCRFWSKAISIPPIAANPEPMANNKVMVLFTFIPMIAATCLLSETARIALPVRLYLRKK